MRAKVVRSDRKIFECRTSDGEILRAQALGNLMKKDAIIVGDLVELSSQDDGEFFIQELIERKNSIFRLHTRNNKIKHIAANIDQVLIVQSVSQPEFKRGLLDRYLVKCQQWGIKPLIVFNKFDELKQGSVDLDFEIKRLAPLDVSFYAVSAKFPEQSLSIPSNMLGLDELKRNLEQKVCAFIGSSGVGKSKLIKALTNSEVDLLSGELGKVGKGAHTTTWAQLVTYPPYEFIDSPGIRALSLLDLDIEKIDDYFPDLNHYFPQCQFKDCQHGPKNKGCVFFQTPLVDNPYIHTRLESYRMLFEELKAIQPY
jgi:ribosome biogenesis GTPase